MKLFYYRHRDGMGNFGDDMNLWLWDKLVPGILNDDDSTIFVGIGSILNDNIPEATRTVVFGSGVGYGKGHPLIDSSWKIYCVRGPLSAAALHLDRDLAITDAAMLLATVYHYSGGKKWKFSLMPHANSSQSGNAAYRQICSDLGIGYIDAREDTETVLKQIGETEVLLTEAMHGAIAAEALGVAWVPYATGKVVFPFKWRDWCASLSLSYEPESILPLWDPVGAESFFGNVKTRSKQLLVSLQVQMLMRKCKPINAKATVKEEKIARLCERLGEFKEDCLRNAFK